VGNDLPLALAWIDKYLKGPDGVVNEEYLARSRADGQALSIRQTISLALKSQNAKKS
jgi:hypothetical protein